MKRPELKFDKPEIKVPAVVEDLYRDLRDRRLLPIVALLLVAIVAVPIALSASGGTRASTAAPTAEIVSAEAPEAQAAVLADNPGLRDYRERLDELKAQNPFDQQFETSGLEGTEVESGTETLDTVSSGGGDVATGTDTAGSTSTSSSGATSTSSPDTSSGSGSVDSDGSTTEPEVLFYSFKADLQYGLEGDVKEHRNVKYLDMLSPVGTFLGASINRETAVFGLSSSVVAVTGGECVPSPDACDFLSLEKGKSAVLAYQRPADPAPANYRLVVDDIRIVKVNEPPVIE
jgi:hypothetical protein